MYEWARKRIKDYIFEKVPEHLRQQVHDLCRGLHPHLGLARWGMQLSSDGVRHTAQRERNAGFEANISKLLAMGLANRARAVQVLEGLQNDLNAAIELLLGYQQAL